MNSPDPGEKKSPKDTNQNSNPPDSAALDAWLFQGYGDDLSATSLGQAEPCPGQPYFIEKTSPCSQTCPANEDIRGILTGLSQSNGQSDDAFQNAWRLLTEKNPFPAISGRLCPAPCEGVCNRNGVDGSVKINAVESAIGDYGIANKLEFTANHKETGAKVAVIGAGPAGLTAALRLRQAGHKVAVFEEMPEAGGMLRYAIAEYRLERSVLDAEINRIFNSGVDFHPNTKAGGNLPWEKIENEYDAIFLAPGTSQGKIPPWQNSEYLNDHAQITTAIDFLYQARLNRKVPQPDGFDLKNREVFIAGDGDVAMDAARLALRLGANVTVLSAVEENEMAASFHERRDTQTEGARFQLTRAITGIQIQENNLVLQTVSMVRKKHGETGHDSPMPFERYRPAASESAPQKTYNAGLLVWALGQQVSAEIIETFTAKPGEPASAAKRTSLKTDRSYRLNFTNGAKQIKQPEKYFAGGDAIKPGLIAEAIAHGNEAAKEIDSYLRQTPGGAASPLSIKVIPETSMHTYYYRQQEAAPPLRRLKNIPSPSEIRGNYNPVYSPVKPDEAFTESSRCMSCGFCFTCQQCITFCAAKALTLDNAKPPGEKIVLNLSLCTGCRACMDVCPCGYIEMGPREPGSPPTKI